MHHIGWRWPHLWSTMSGTVPVCHEPLKTLPSLPKTATPTPQGLLQPAPGPALPHVPQEFW